MATWNETGPEPGSRLRDARAARGWSQADAARALGTLAQDRGVAVATPVSLKTQLSRWENGHSTPDAPYRSLLTELYEGVDLGIDPPPAAGPPDPAERLLARVAAAAAVDAEVVALWTAQLTVARGLDERLGGSGPVDAVRVLVAQLDAVLPHLPDPPRRRAVAVLLAEAAVLAGAQALDAGDADDAVARYARAAEVARAAGAPGLAVEATIGHAEALVEVGAPRAALAVLEHAPSSPPWARALRAATAVARAAAGDPTGARRALHAVDRTGPPAGLAVELAPEALRPSGERHPATVATDHWHGRALALLGDPAAVAHLERALSAGPGSVRVRAALHAELARALEAVGRGDATRHTAAARELVRRTGSRRTARLLDAQGPFTPPPGSSPARSAAPSSSSAAR